MAAIAERVDHFRMLIDGEWTDGASTKMRPIINPATEEVVAEVPDGMPDDAHRAIDAASRAFQDWSRLTPYERARYLKRAADLIRERTEEIARLMTLEVGKTIKESRMEVRMAADYFEWYAEEAKRNYGDIVPQFVPQKRHWVIRQPVGVVATITPWNFPANLLARKVARVGGGLHRRFQTRPPNTVDGDGNFQVPARC